ncbi:MAG: 3-deoxy-8-phosphooctulonate synthase [Alphaproteobacteria bacterium GM7ARS4]|nr:3-deoxy-8-phosphooctulonate synthase [Alphaproteobacteria bacterium GM7ARS4]
MSQRHTQNKTISSQTPWALASRPQRCVTIGEHIRLGHDAPLVIIAGPCALESLSHARMMAEKLCHITDTHGVRLIFKSSFDKANRSKYHANRGIGMEKGLVILDALRKEFQCPVITDVHEAHQCADVAKIADIIQIPAFLCRQTDLLCAAAETGNVINVKKGQFLAPWDMAHVVDKISACGNERILVTERGSSFGYNMLVNDMRSLPLLGRLGYPVVFDATHSVQLPGGAVGEGQSGGHRQFIAPLARAAVAVGIAALFVEVHDTPDKAPSDGANMLTLTQLDNLLTPLKQIDTFIKHKTQDTA